MLQQLRFAGALRRLGGAAIIAVASVGPAHGQGPTVAAAQSALGRCSYETCAIRLDRTFFGGRRVNIGLDAVSSPMGLVGGGLANAVNRVPLALAEAQMGRRNAIKATVAAVVGSIAVLYITQGAFSDPLGSSDAQFVGGLLVSVAATGTGVVQSVYAERHFSRAVWLYNRELAH